MSGPYRESATSSIECPRCGETTAAGDIVACINGCGVWVAAEAAAAAFEAAELRESRITSWFRERCNCPLCGTRMTLRGHDMSLFLGCDAHGLWVDDSTVTQTGLGRVAVAARLAHARASAKATRDRRDQARAEETERAKADQRSADERAADEQRARIEAAARAERIRRAREDAVRPYLELVRGAERDPLPLAEKLHELEQRIALLESSRRE